MILHSAKQTEIDNAYMLTISEELDSIQNEFYLNTDTDLDYILSQELVGQLFDLSAYNITEDFDYSTIDFNTVTPLITIEPYIPPTEQDLFDEAKVHKTNEILSGFSSACKLLTGDTPQSEIDSFGKQEIEADKYSADNAYVSPLLTAISSERGITVAELVTKINAKVSFFENAFGILLGKQQAYIDQLNDEDSVQTVADVEAIIVDYS